MTTLPPAINYFEEITAHLPSPPALWAFCLQYKIPEITQNPQIK